MTKLTKRLMVLACSALAAFGLQPAPAQASDYPTGPIRMIVPFGAGGGFDTLVRTLQPGLEQELGVPLAIVNTPGAGGRRGAIDLFRSTADGYTIGLSYFLPFIIDREIMGDELPIDLDAFEVIQRSTVQNMFMYVAEGSGFETLDDLIAADRPLRVATTGIGSVAWVGGEVLSNLLGFETVYVPGYANLNEAALSVVRGDVDVSFGAPVHFGGVVDDVRPLVFLGPERDWQFSDVPTIVELGFPQAAQLGVVHVFSAPPGTDPEKVEVLAAAFRSALSDEDFAAWAQDTATAVAPGDAAVVRAYREELAELFRGMDFDLEE